MMTRRLFGILVWFGMSCVFPAFALEPQTKIAVEPKTGDVEFDAALGDLNIAATGNLAGFLHHLSVSYNVPEEDLEPLMTEAEMEPADVYMTVVVADLTETPLEDVVAEYRSSEGRGWGEIAKRLGIKPGSEEFHQLKQGVLADSEEVKRAPKPGGKPENPGQEKKEKKAKKK